MQRRIGSQADMLNFVRGRAAVKLLTLFSTQEFNFKISTLSVHFHERVDTKNASHARVWHFEAVRKGLEPSTSGVTGRHSNQLNYRTNAGCDETRMQR